MSTTRTLPLLVLLAPIVAFGQGTIQLYSDVDAVIGYHYNLNSENTNYDYADWFGALSQPGNSGGENNSRALIYFDLTDFPPGTVIDEATLDLYGIGAVGLGAAASVGNMGANTCFLEQINQPWADNTVTWNTQPSVTPLNSIALPQSTQLIEDYLGIDVTALVQAMINDPSQAFGFMIRTQIEDPTQGLFFCGNGYSNPTKRPRLNVKPHGWITVPEIAGLEKLGLSPNPISLDQTSWLVLPERAVGGRISVMDASGRRVDDFPLGDRSGHSYPIVVPTTGRFFVVLFDRKGVAIGCAELVAVRE